MSEFELSTWVDKERIMYALASVRRVFDQAGDIDGMRADDLGVALVYGMPPVDVQTIKLIAQAIERGENQ